VVIPFGSVFTLTVTLSPLPLLRLVSSSTHIEFIYERDLLILRSKTDVGIVRVESLRTDSQPIFTDVVMECLSKRKERLEPNLVLPHTGRTFGVG
jgi:hypothetical protein